MFNHNNTNPQRDWRDRATSVSSTQTSSSSSTLHIAQRRRTSAAHVRPAGPPPNLPMPSIPTSAEIQEPHYAQYAMYSQQDLPPTPYHRATPSPNLTALATFSQARQQQQQQQYQQPISPSEETLSDSPPPSFLPLPVTRTTPAPHRYERDHHTDTHLLAPPDQHSSSTHRRPSPRRTLTRALELAREAVTLDATNDDPYAAVIAYGKSVALLSEVMERVRRGEESTERRRSESNGRRRSIVAQEEEIRRLKSIHDTYADRMSILSLIYHIPPQHHLDGLYSTSTSTTSTQPPSPTSSTSPTSESSANQPSPRTDAFYIDNPLSLTSEEHAFEENMDNIGIAMYEPQNQPGTPSTITPPTYHPYSSRHESQPQVAVTSHRSSVIGRRPRASSNLPPPPPPPSGSPPPPPVSVIVDAAPDIPVPQAVSRSRAGSVNGHQRTGSGSRLESLREETERFEVINEMGLSPSPRASVFQDASRHTRHESHPLPPIPDPSPTSSDGFTPRTDVPPPLTTSRPRGSSIRSNYDAPQLINTSTNMGTISQRRMKTPAPPLHPVRAPSPTDSTESHGSVGSLPKTPAPVPQIPVNGIRTRASSQPGRRPSVVAGFQQDQPPLPATAGSNGAHLIRSLSTRKSRPPPPLPLVSTDCLPSNLPPTANFLATNGPLTPTSPLPSAPPADPLRKPYHLMNLLRNTMMSQSGGYVTRRLHVPQEVWSQGGVKLPNLGEKIRVVEILSASLEDLATTSSEYFGAGNVGSGLALGIGAIGRKEGEAWVSKLEEFSSVCENVVANFGKKLGVGEGFVSKKPTGMSLLGGKLSRRLDRLTNAKNLESPGMYVQGLKQLFLHAQLLDEHTQAVLASAPVYDAMPNNARNAAETKLRRSSEFFASVVLTFVIRDLSLLLDKYAKKCEKWLAE